MKKSFMFSQVKRLFSRDPRDIVSFLKYYAKTSPARFIDRFPGKSRKNYSLGSYHHFEGEISPAPDAISEYVQGLADFGKSIVENESLNLLGRNLSIGWPPNWETSETGSYPKGYSNSIPYYGDEIVNDIKLIWELHNLVNNSNMFSTNNTSKL